MRRAWTLIVGASLLTASCSTGASSSDAANEPPATEPSATGAPPATSTTTTTASTTTTSTTTTTTTVPVGQAEIMQACETLATASFVERSAIVAGFADTFATAGGEGDAIEAARAVCAADWDRTADAVAVRARFEAIDAAFTGTGGPIVLSDLDCNVSTDTFTVKATNRSDEPIGVNFEFALFAGDSDVEERLATSLNPVVRWSIDPGQTVPVGARVIVDPADLSRNMPCSVNYEWFLADDSEADAALIEPTDSDLVGDDPNVWVPRLLELAEEVWGTGDADVVGLIEDIRSNDYQYVVEGINGEQGGKLILNGVRVCDQWDDLEGDDQRSIVYVADYGADSYINDAGETVDRPARRVTRVALFRRGSDGQWRWLGRATQLQSTAYADCAAQATADQ